MFVKNINGTIIVKNVFNSAYHSLIIEELRDRKIAQYFISFVARCYAETEHHRVTTECSVFSTPGVLDFLTTWL